MRNGKDASRTASEAAQPDHFHPQVSLVLLGALTLPFHPDPRTARQFRLGVAARAAPLS